MIAYIYRVTCSTGYEWFPVDQYDQAKTLFNRWNKQRLYPAIVLESIDPMGQTIELFPIVKA